MELAASGIRGTFHSKNRHAQKPFAMPPSNPASSVAIPVAERSTFHRVRLTAVEIEVRYRPLDRIHHPQKSVASKYAFRANIRREPSGGRCIQGAIFFLGFVDIDPCGIPLICGRAHDITKGELMQEGST